MTEAARESPLPPPWWVRWKGRLEAELAQFARHDLPVTLIEDPSKGARRLVVETSIRVSGYGETRLRILYPDGFPHRRFSILAPDLRLPRHQAFGGELCVIARGAEHWHPQYMAADFVVHRVGRLIDLVDQGGQVLWDAEDPQGEPLTSYYHSPLQGGVIVDDRVLKLNLEPAVAGSMELRLTPGAWLHWPEAPPPGWSPIPGQALLFSLKDAAGAQLLEGPPLDRLAARFGPPTEGRWVYLSEPPYAESPSELWAAACAANEELKRWTQRTQGRQFVGICTREEVGHGIYDNAWVFLTRTVEVNRADRATRKKGNPAVRGPQRIESFPVIIRALRWGEQDLGARIPELAALRDRNVTVFGLGSLGAPFVQEMVKSRLGGLRLADHDHIDAGTSVRYPLGLEQAGSGKPFALARWAVLHNPEVSIDVALLHIGGVSPLKPEVTESEILHRLMIGTDLLVSATAEHDVNRQLDELGLAYGVPRLFMWSVSGYGGIVALLQDGRTGCYHCLSLLLSDRASAGAPLVQAPEPVDGKDASMIQGRGCADRTFSAAHADLLPISIHAARVAFGHLCAAAPGGYPPMVGDVFAVQVRQRSGQPIPPSWTTVNLPPDPRCPQCHPS